MRINSTADLSKLIYEQFKVPYPSIMTGKGKPSTNTEALDQIEHHDGIVTLVKRAKELKAVYDGSKRFVEYFKNYRGLTVVFPSIESIGYDGTGRVYTKNPSINQLPRAIS